MSIYKQMEDVIGAAGDCNGIRDFGKAVNQDKKNEFKDMELGKAALGIIATILSKLEEIKILDERDGRSHAVNIGTLVITWGRVGTLYIRM